MTSRETPLPEPWRVRATLPVAEQEALEATVGSRLTFEDLDKTIDIRELPPSNGYVPVSDRAMRVLGHRWAELENVDTDVTVIVRLQHLAESVEISAVVFPYSDGHDLTGSDLRGLPIAALNAAFTRDEQRGNANTRIMLALGGDANEDPMRKLPPATALDSFSARVARQFTAIEAQDPAANVARAMAEHNDVPLSSVQRWIARARKQGFIPPAAPKRGASASS